MSNAEQPPNREQDPTLRVLASEFALYGPRTPMESAHIHGDEPISRPEDVLTETTPEVQE